MQIPSKASLQKDVINNDLHPITMLYYKKSSVLQVPFHCENSAETSYVLPTHKSFLGLNLLESEMS